MPARVGLISREGGLLSPCRWTCGYEIYTWNYSDANQLIQQFFSCLSAALDVQIKGSKLPEIGETIKEYSDALGSAT